MATQCTKLKSFIVSDGSYNVNTIKLLCKHHYPTLEHLKYEPGERDQDTRIAELKIFLENHTNLKRFECNQTFLWANRDLIIDAEIQWNLLTLDLDSSVSAIDRFFIDFLQTLHERNIYKALHLLFDVRHSDYENIISKLPSLQILSAYKFSIKDDDSTELINLKELCLHHGDLSDINSHAVTKRLTKLERLSFKRAIIDDLLPFIRYSKCLKTIKIELSFENISIVLIALNEECKRHANARKLIIYLPESDYLAAKWNLNTVYLSHIEFKRFIKEK